MLDAICFLLSFLTPLLNRRVWSLDITLVVDFQILLRDDRQSITLLWNWLIMQLFGCRVAKWFSLFSLTCSHIRWDLSKCGILSVGSAPSMLGNLFPPIILLLWEWCARPQVGFECFVYIILNFFWFCSINISEDPPPNDAMRCVPEKWCSPTKTMPVKVWDDTGSGGGRPGSIWVINSMDMIAVTTGHEPPKDTFYEVSSTRFFIDSSQLPAEALEN